MLTTRDNKTTPTLTNPITSLIILEEVAENVTVKHERFSRADNFKQDHKKQIV
jgi:hypothetical protein